MLRGLNYIRNELNEDECYLIGGFISGFADLTFMLITQKVYVVREK